MTAQISEKLFYQGRPVRLCSEPLETYFSLSGEPRPFKLNHCSALWRGYVGTWEIINGHLYMIDISATSDSEEEITLDALFPGFPDRVYAHWYSGSLRITQGEQIKYVHSGYASQYEYETLLTVERGLVTATQVNHYDQLELENA